MIDKKLLQVFWNMRWLMYYNDFLKLLGERIRFIRKTKKIKQEKLAGFPLFQFFHALCIQSLESRGGACIGP